MKEGSTSQGFDRFELDADTTYSLAFPEKTSGWKAKLEAPVVTDTALKIGTTQARVEGSNYITLAAGETHLGNSILAPDIFLRSTEDTVVQISWERLDFDAPGELTLTEL
jgi:hypothetical protein